MWVVAICVADICCTQNADTNCDENRSREEQCASYLASRGKLAYNKQIAIFGKCPGTRTTCIALRMTGCVAYMMKTDQSYVQFRKHVVNVLHVADG